MPGLGVVGGFFVGAWAAGDDDDFVEVGDEGFYDESVVAAGGVEAAAVYGDFFHDDLWGIFTAKGGLSRQKGWWVGEG